MAPFKGRASVGPVKGVECRGTSKNVGVSKFKIYSENRDIVGANYLRTSLLPKKATLPTKSTDVKDLPSDARESRGSHDNLDKTEIKRKALADVSNIRGTSSRMDKPGGSRNSMTFGALASTASSSRPLAVKVKPNLPHGLAVLHASGKGVAGSNKTMRTSSNRVQAWENVESKPRHISRSNNTFARLNAQRKSYPVLKKPNLFDAKKLQGDVTSPVKSTRKLGIPLKTKAGGKVVCHLSNHKEKVLKNRVSNIVMVPKSKTSKDVPQKLRKSFKPVVRTGSLMSNAHKSSKANSKSCLDKSLVTISSRGVKVAKSSISKNFKCLDSHQVAEGGYPAKHISNNQPEMSEITADIKSNRRKSYTSLLISNSKLLKNSEVTEQEKLRNIDDQDNPLEVAEYVDDIYQYYWTMEVQGASLENYIMIQTDITPQMRGILINWLIEVHFKFELMPETLYLTVALLDKYLSIVSISKNELQLVGLTSLLLASKYEDFWHPRVKDLISISAESYTRKQMLAMEKDILKKLKFRLNLPTAYVFMLRFLKASQSDEQLEHLAFYLIELCLVEYEALKFRPSLLCASAVYVACCTLNKVPAWTPLLSKHARYEEFQIRDCAEMILRLHKSARTGLLMVTYDKYKRPEFGGVASIKPLDFLPL